MKVKTSLNSKFADIVFAAGEAVLKDEDEDKANESDSTLDCILIE
jgi:hypothetical protein